MKTIEKKILDQAIKTDLINNVDVSRIKEIKKDSGENVDQVLLQLKLLTKEQLYILLEEITGYPTVNLEELSLEKEVLDLIPEAIARKNQAVPLFKAQDTLAMALVDPLNIEIIDNIQLASGFTIEPFTAAPTDIRKALDRYYGGRKSMAELFESRLESESENIAEAILFKGFEEEQKGSSPVKVILNRLLLQAIRENSSDIHIESWGEKLSVRFRIDGILHEVPEPQFDMYDALVSRIKILGSMDIAEKRIPQDGRVDVIADGKEVGLRLSTFPTHFGEKVVIRLLDKGNAITEMGTLGFRGESLKGFLKIISEPHGIALATGPTGSGKTTTLYAALNKLKGSTKNVITIEDPIEYQMNLICQSQVNPKAGLTFATGLRAILRQDPDVIMVGEIRDGETAELAVHSALTGHLVFSTLHTNDSAGAVARLIDMGIEPFLISSSVAGIIAQRLVRLVCSDCSEETKPGAGLLEMLGLEAAEQEPVFYRGAGCNNCKGTGYKGRMGIYEVLKVDNELRDLISRGSSSSVLRKTAVSNGMVTMREDGLEKALEGLTSLEEVLRVTGTQ